MVFACRSNFRNTIFWHCFFNHVMCSLVYFSIFLICSSALCSCWLLFTCDKAEILLVLCCNLPDINLFVFFYLDSADGVDILARAFCSMGCV